MPSFRAAADLLREGRGACTAKHLLLRDLLESVGVEARIETVRGMFGAGLTPAAGMGAPLRDMIRDGGVPDFHHFVAAKVGGQTVALDATWHDALIPHGFPVNADWRGRGDTRLAVSGERLPTPRGGVSDFKANLIETLSQDERERRGIFLRLLTEWIAGL